MPIVIPCPVLPIAAGGLCITLPGGAEVCATIPGVIPPTPDQLVKQLFSQMSAALAPLQPIFDIMDALLAVQEIVETIATLKLKKIKKALPDFIERMAQIAKYVPPVSIIAMVAGLIDAMILFLRGLQSQYQFQLLYIQKIINAETLLGRTGLDALNDMVNCAKGNQDSFMLTLNEGNKPIATLIAVINTFLGIINLGQYKIPELGEVSVGALPSSIAALDVTIELLTVIRSAIPF